MTRPTITIDPAVCFGTPQIGGTRTWTLAYAVWTDGVTTTADEYGRTRHEVLLACWYEATYQRDRYWRAWRDWAKQAGPILAGRQPGGPDTIPDPADHTGDPT